MSSSLTYRPDIDGLRSLAVVPVVLFHAGVSGFGGGFVGVDIFFVISGFLITSIIYRELSEGRFSIVRFYERRARRILPALFAVILSTLVAGWFILPPIEYAQMGQSILATLVFLSNMWFWQNSGGYFDGATDYLPMLHTWSLAVEEQFYIFFPLLLMLLFRVLPRRLVLVVSAVFLMSFVMAVVLTPRMPSASFYLLPARIWELGLGALLALGALPVSASRAVRESVGVLGLVAVLAPVFFYDKHTLFPGLAALPPVLGAAALIWAGTGSQVAASRLLALRPLVWIGLISYSLYLWHWPIMAFARNWLLSVELDVSWQGVTVAASFAAATLSWHWVERPFRTSAKDGGFSQRRIFWLSGLSSGAIALISASLFWTQGYAYQRYSPDEVAVLNNEVFFPRARECRSRTSAEDLCTFGTSEEGHAPKWILWGDSHAEAILPALDALARNHEQSLLFASMGHCAPLPDVERSERTPSSREECDRFKRDVVNRLESDKSIQRVFLHARWAMYVEGSRFGPSKDKKITLIDPNFPSQSGVSKQDNPEIVSRSLNNLVARLKTAGKDVVIISPIPEIPWNVLDHMKGNVLRGAPFPDDPERSIVDDRQKRTTAILTDVARKNDVQLVHVTPALCPERCPTHGAAQAYYRDTNHLTPYAATELLLPILEDALSEELK